MGKDIDEVRKAIDAIDDELLALIQKRCGLSVEIGRLKVREGLGPFDPSRERAIVDRLAAKAKPPLTRAMIETVFAQIFSASRSLQKRKAVAYLGPEGSYSHQAARQVFSLDADLQPRPDIGAVIAEVLTGRADLGIVPVENSTEGMVNLTLDLMSSAKLFVCGEIMLPIRNCLLSLSPLKEVKKVYSHPQALAQCRKWILDNLGNAETVETPSTSTAALAAREEPGSAAIASALAAELYGLAILAENINDCQENITRFWVVSRAMAPVTGRAKTSIIVSLENIPGALHHATGVFASKGINLTKIESRPSKKNPWEYVFFIDFEGSLDDGNVREALADIKAYTREIIILGSYPEGRIPD
jgi:chorismate mutase / prephenate dehydratase